MASYLTPAMLVLADDPAACRAPMDTAALYAPRTLALASDDVAEVPGADVVVTAGRGGPPNLDALFRTAVQERVSWVAVRRDLDDPRAMLAAALAAAGKRATKDIPAFALLIAAPEARPISRILVLVDRTDGEHSGSLALAAVAAAQTTGASLDVLMFGAPGETMSIPNKAVDVLQMNRGKELFERAQRRAKESGIAVNWIVGEDVADRSRVVLEQIAEGEYDLVIDDLGDVALRGRLGRSRRIDRVFEPDGQGSIPLAVLSRTDVAFALVLDGVRLGVVPPAVIKGGAAAFLAIGILGAGAPTASASQVRQDQSTSISQQVDATNQELNTVIAPASVPDQATSDQAVAQAADDSGSTEDQAVAQDTADDQMPPDSIDDQGAPDSAEDQAAPEAPNEAAPVVTPEQAPTVDPASIEVEGTPTADEVHDAQDAADDSKAALDEAQNEFEDAQAAAEDGDAAVADALASADQASADLDAAEDAFAPAAAESVDVAQDTSGLRGVIPGGASDDDLAAADAQALAAEDAVASAQDEATAALDDYEQAIDVQTEAQAHLEETSAAVTDADAAYQEDAAVAEATSEAFADAIVAPLPEGSYTVGSHEGDEGPHWSLGYHTGTDLIAPVGTEVDAAAAGTVVSAGWDDAYGNRVVVEHEGGYYTTYNHMSEIDVQVGDEVGPGDKVGEVGETGNAFGAHLHFEVTQGGDGWGSGTFLDPETVVPL